MSTHALAWFRRDLRLADNPAWAAATRADSLTALFVMEPTLVAAAGPVRRTQLFAHLAALDAALGRLGGRLLVRRGTAHEVVPAVAAEVGATVVTVNGDVTPFARRRDAAVERALGAKLEVWWGNYVHPPGHVRTAKGTTSLIFSPFFASWTALPLASGPRPRATRIDSDPGEGIPHLDSAPFHAGGERAGAGRLAAFADRVDAYGRTRDLPAVEGTSELSSDLHFGVLSPRKIIDTIGTASESRAAFVRQLAWRDWFAHLMVEKPESVAHAWRRELDAIVWENDPTEIAAWKAGRTGYPIVDAGMRQLESTGFMHNRVRMIAASFLVKDLLVDWRIGERWFRRQLVDGDVAQNVGNWQWVAGTGPDATPYFRVFNPTLQSKKFDAQGAYIRRFVPELAQLPERWIHEPWAAPDSVRLHAAGYPPPIVDHAIARRRALAAYGAARGTAVARARRSSILVTPPPLVVATPIARPREVVWGELAEIAHHVKLRCATQPRSVSTGTSGAGWAPNSNVTPRSARSDSPIE